MCDIRVQVADVAALFVVFVVYFFYLLRFFSCSRATLRFPFFGLLYALHFTIATDVAPKLPTRTHAA